MTTIARVGGFSQYRNFHLVSFFTAVDEPFQWFFIIDSGINILSTGKKKAITHVHELL